MNRRFRVPLLAAALLSAAGCTSHGPAPAAVPAPPKKTLMVVLAHPDDESMIGPLLAGLARRGHAVEVLIATDGKYGTRLPGVVAGDELGALRRKESECAAEKLGIPPPKFLGIDRLDTRNGVRQYLDGRKVLLAALERHLAEIDPDALLTFGPDGEYGHPEHIVVGAAITELLLRKGLVDRYPLYYFGWRQEQVADDEELGYVDSRYLTTRLGFTDEDERKSFAAAECYATQFTREEIDELIARESADETNSYYFRKLVAPAAEAAAEGFAGW